MPKWALPEVHLKMIDFAKTRRVDGPGSPAGRRDDGYIKGLRTLLMALDKLREARDLQKGASSPTNAAGSSTQRFFASLLHAPSMLFRGGHRSGSPPTGPTRERATSDQTGKNSPSSAASSRMRLPQGSKSCNDLSQV